MSLCCDPFRKLVTSKIFVRTEGPNFYITQIHFFYWLQLFYKRHKILQDSEKSIEHMYHLDFQR